ncbi:MAG: nitroreductase family protein, partial [Acidaminococcaceae bacterium]|nr:nitroreductase family protein [Acidaminococcaceae bacterium]
MDLIKVDRSKCVKCGLCVADCPACILDMGNDGPECNVDRGCMSCGHCVAICPTGAMDNKYTPREEMIPVPKECISASQAYDFLRSRRSVRLFRPQAPKQEDVLKLLDICRYAPTAGNSQGMYFTIVSNPDMLAKIRQYTADWMAEEVEKGTENKRYFKAVLHTFHEKKVDIIERQAPMLVFVSTRRLNVTGISNSEQCLAYAELFAPSIGLGTTIAGCIQACAIDGYKP